MNSTYQKNAAQMQMEFPADTTWIAQTDHVSHAVLRGQFLLEQIFYV